MELFIIDARCNRSRKAGFQLSLYGRDDENRPSQVNVHVPKLPILIQSAQAESAVKRRLCTNAGIQNTQFNDLGQRQPNPAYEEIQTAVIYRKLLFGHVPSDADPIVAKEVRIVELQTANPFTWRSLKKAAGEALHEEPISKMRPVESFKSEVDVCMLKMGIRFGTWVRCHGDYTRPLEGVRVFHASDMASVVVVDKPLLPVLRAGSFDLECSTMLPRPDGTWSVACNPEEHPIISIGLAVCDLANGDEATAWQRHFFFWSRKTAAVINLQGGDESALADQMRAEEAAAIERGDFVKHAAEDTPMVVHACASEQHMFSTFAQVVRRMHIDWLVSYNGLGFDNPYLATRIRKCWLQEEEDKRQCAWAFGRAEKETRPPKRAGAPPTAEELKKAIASRLAGRIVLEPTAFDTIGLAAVDALVYAQSLNLESAKLSEVSTHLFGAEDSKVDLDYEEMMQLGYDDTASGWGKIAVYNLRDSLMPLRILSAKKQFGFSLQLSRVSGCALPAITAGGQSKRLLSMVMREAEARGMVINEPSKQDFPSAPWLHGGGTKVKGALVLDIEPGFYSDPVVVTDYASLYPSILISFNLSFETLLNHNANESELEDAVPQALKEVTRVFHVEERDEAMDVVSLTWHYPVIQKGPNGEREGVYPCIVRKLLEERKAAKKQMKQHEVGSPMHVILDARQNALKVLCNSAYGVLNAVLKGRLYCRPLGAIITSEGRNAIRTIVATVEKIPNSLVVAGDTDSCMFLLRGRTMAEAFESGEQVAKDVNAALRAYGALDMNLELEKVMSRSIFVQKKCYSYMKLESLDGKPKHVSMGLLSKKRGTAQLLKDAFIDCEHAYLIPQEFDARSVRLLQLRILRELMRSLAKEVEINQFVRTSFLHHQYREDFQGAHVMAARRWCQETKAPWPGGGRIKTLLAQPSRVVKDSEYKAYMYTYTYEHFQKQGLALDLSRYLKNVSGRFQALLRFTIPDIAERFKRAVQLLANAGSQQRLAFHKLSNEVPSRMSKPVQKMSVDELREAIDATAMDGCVGDATGAYIFTNTKELVDKTVEPPTHHKPPTSDFCLQPAWAALLSKRQTDEAKEQQKRQKRIRSEVETAAGGSGFSFDALM